MGSVAYGYIESRLVANRVLCRTAIAHPAPPKPHWAKWNAPFLIDSDDFVGQYAQAAFWEQIPAFRAAVLEADPIGVFRNRWLERLFHLDQV